MLCAIAKSTLTTLMCIISAHLAYAQSVEDKVEIYFRQDIHKIEADLGDNKERLEQLTTLLNKVTADSLANISKIEINSWTSPEPGVEYNQKLSKRRSEALKEYIMERWDIPDSLLIATGRGIAWDKLRTIVAASEEVKYREEILDILDNTPEETWRRVNPNDRWLTLVDSRLKQLMDLKGGRAYKWLYDNVFPELRYGSQVSLFYKYSPQIAQHTSVDKIIQMPEIEIPEITLQPWSDRDPILALKTNLLFDAVTVLNVEVEVPIKERYSVLAEWNFPWWVAKDNGSALEILSGSLEARYWFGDRSDKPKLTGWFGGIYGGGGLYDLQWNNNGYQGEFFIAAGLSGGYAHTINKSETLRLEYSLGLGYLKTNYRYYEGRLDNQYLVWQYDGRYTWMGPTKAKISLAWMLHRKRGGVR